MDTKTARWNLLWAVQRSARYHARRQGFFDRWRLITSGANVVFGSAAAVNVVAQGGVGLTLAATFVITVLSAIDLVVGSSTMARLHSDLRRQFLAIEGEIRCKPEATQEDIDRWTLQRLRIEADEPPVYEGLDLLCENELARAHGSPPRAVLSGWVKATAHLFRWEGVEFKSAQ